MATLPATVNAVGEATDRYPADYIGNSLGGKDQADLGRIIPQP